MIGGDAAVFVADVVAGAPLKRRSADDLLRRMSTVSTTARKATTSAI
eukprot:COSAG02_NODE_46241_length_350_cov_1.159363_2_plen_46_part_01